MRKRYKILFIILFFVLLLFVFSTKINAASISKITSVTIKYKGQVLDPNGGPYQISKQNAGIIVEVKKSGFGYWYSFDLWGADPNGKGITEKRNRRDEDGVWEWSYGYSLSFKQTGPAQLRLRVREISVGDKWGITDGEETIVYDISIPIIIVDGADTGETREPIEFVDVLDNIDNYVPGEMVDEDAKEVEDIVSKILSIITTIGMIVTILIPAILGVKYMLGSVEEKAEYKKDLIPYVIGAMLLFGICTIIKVTQGFGNQINGLT